MDAARNAPTDDREQILDVRPDRRGRERRHRPQRVRLAAARRHRRRPDGGVPLPPRPDPVPAALRRRLVAVICLADGMFFVQSRIGMNDAYVGLFIVAAYAMFAALWMGVWFRGAFWVGFRSSARCSGWGSPRSGSPSMPSAGSPSWSWSAAPSAGFSTIVALIGMTAGLGYLAINVPAGNRIRQPAVRRDHGRADGRRGHRQRRPPGRLVARRDPVRGRRPDRPRRHRDARPRRDRPGDPGADGRRDRPRLARDRADGRRRGGVPPRADRLGRVRDGRTPRLRPAGPAACRGRARRPPAGPVTAAVRRVAAARRPARPAGRLDARLPARPRSRSTSSSYIPWAFIENHRSSPTGRTATPASRCST